MEWGFELTLMVHSKYFRWPDRSWEAVGRPFVAGACRACGVVYKLNVPDHAGSLRTIRSY